jgi:hypothetical protein
MRKTLIMGVLFIGILTLGIVNTYAGHSLDLSKPENIQRLTGTWEGTWLASSGTHGPVTMVFSYDPKPEEKPFVRQTKTRNSPLADPSRFSTDRGEIVDGNLVFVGTQFDVTLSLHEGADGKLSLQGEGVGRVNLQGARVTYALHKSEGGKPEAPQATKQ